VVFCLIFITTCCCPGDQVFNMQGFILHNRDKIVNCLGDFANSTKATWMATRVTRIERMDTDFASPGAKIRRQVDIF